MKDAIDAIKSQIKNTRAALEKLKEDEKELQRLQFAVSTLPKVQTDLAALERTLAILKGDETPEPVQPIKASIPNLVYSILKEAGKPMTGDQILPRLAAKGRHVKKLSMVGAIYRCIKNDQLFKLVAPGTFGLSDWPDHK